MDCRDGFGRLWDIFFHCLSLKNSESISATFFTVDVYFLLSLNFAFNILFLSPFIVLVFQAFTCFNGATPPASIRDFERSAAIMRVEVYVFRGRDIPQVEDQSY